MEFEISQILAHLVIYLVVIIALKKLYIDPSLSLIRKREALTSGRMESGQELAKQIESMKLDYSKAWGETKEDLEERRTRVLKEVREEVDKKLSQAKTDNERKLSDHQKILSNQLKELDKKIPQLASELSKEIVESVMNAKVVRL